jgi:3-methyladenine DNA glycosylase/8-oxoguanine DNA glycosylase
MFRLDEDFVPFYAAIETDPQLAWAASGAGRMLASPTVFEDVIKTICTTNCAWSGTVRMVIALVEKLGEGAFPEPRVMARAPEKFYRDVARAGYRGAYLKKLAADVAAGALDLEALRPEFGLPDAEVEKKLLELPGVGPYACAHIMMLLGRYHRLIFDSWTRPAYLRLSGRRRASDAAIVRAFRGYGAFAGLAFWLQLTHGWVADQS